MTKYTILFLAANPGGTDPRALDREARSIRAELKRIGYRDRFNFQTRWAAEPLDLLRELRELKPTVVHFSGNGGQEVSEGPHQRPLRQRDLLDPESGNDRNASPGLYLHGRDRGGRFVSGDA